MEPELNCNTEKDKGVRLNARTTGKSLLQVNYKFSLSITFLSNEGVLAGLWPCGVIAMVSELFISESKSQVYGNLHDFLQASPETAKKLSKLAIYL